MSGNARLRRRIEITAETWRLLVVRRPGALASLWCEQCGAHAAFLPADLAAAVTARTAREVYRLVEASEVHFVESADGSVLVCLLSLI